MSKIFPEQTYWPFHRDPPPLTPHPPKFKESSELCAASKHQQTKSEDLRRKKIIKCEDESLNSQSVLQTPGVKSSSQRGAHFKELNELESREEDGCRKRRKNQAVSLIKNKFEEEHFALDVHSAPSRCPHVS